VFYQLSADADSLFKNIPFNPSLGLFLIYFIFSIIEKKIKVKINSYEYCVSRIALKKKYLIYGAKQKTKFVFRISVRSLAS